VIRVSSQKTKVRFDNPQQVIMMSEAMNMGREIQLKVGSFPELSKFRTFQK